jgi:hypothetical protein
MPLDEQDLMEFLEEVDRTLSRRISLIAVGGTAMTLLNMKASTIDIDFNLSARDAPEL